VVREVTEGLRRDRTHWSKRNTLLSGYLGPLKQFQVLRATRRATPPRSVPAILGAGPGEFPETPSPKRYRRLELPFSFTVDA
jgi:hypothetical protein